MEVHDILILGLTKLIANLNQTISVGVRRAVPFSCSRFLYCAVACWPHVHDHQTLPFAALFCLLGVRGAVPCRVCGQWRRAAAAGGKASRPSVPVERGVHPQDGNRPQAGQPLQAGLCRQRPLCCSHVPGLDFFFFFACLEMAWLGLGWLGLAWIGLAWIQMYWIGFYVVGLLVCWI